MMTLLFFLATIDGFQHEDIDFDSVMVEKEHVKINRYGVPQPEPEKKTMRS